jgi:hypothetical protein
MKLAMLILAATLSGCATTCDTHPVRCAVAMAGEAIMVGVIVSTVMHQRRGPAGPTGPAGPPGGPPPDACPGC